MILFHKRNKNKNTILWHESSFYDVEAYGRYLTYIASVSAGTKAVFRLNLQYGTRKAVTPMPMHITGQTWSLDGASIYFVTDLPEAHSIWVADAGFQQAPQWTGITGTNPSAKIVRDSGRSGNMIL